MPKSEIKEDIEKLSGLPKPATGWKRKALFGNVYAPIKLECQCNIRSHTDED